MRLGPYLNYLIKSLIIPFKMSQSPVSLSNVPGPSRHEASESSCRPLQWPNSKAKPRPQATPSLFELRLSVLRPDQGGDEESAVAAVEDCVGENLASDSTP